MPADRKYLAWRFSGGFCEYLRDHNRIGIQAIQDPPVAILIPHAKLMTPLADVRQRSRMRHAQLFAFLQQPEKRTGFDSSTSRERRSLDLAVQPHQRLSCAFHGCNMSASYVTSDMLARARARRQSWPSSFPRGLSQQIARGFRPVAGAASLLPDAFGQWPGSLNQVRHCFAHNIRFTAVLGSGQATHHFGKFIVELNGDGCHGIAPLR